MVCQSSCTTSGHGAGTAGLTEEKSEKQKQYPLTSLLQVIIRLEVVLILSACWQPGMSPTMHMACWMSSPLSLQPVTLRSHLSAWQDQGLRFLWPLCAGNAADSCSEQGGPAGGRAATSSSDLLLRPAPGLHERNRNGSWEHAWIGCANLFPLFKKKMEVQLIYNIVLTVQ